MSPFGRKVKALRLARNMTQEDLAKHIDMTRQMVSYLESRAANPTADILRKLARFFGVTVDELILEATEKQKKPGPSSHLEAKIKQLRKLPQSQQKTVIQMLDGLLAASR